ncbi:MAG: hypothetical protein ABI980_13465, partial [Nitrospirota bacterium]
MSRQPFITTDLRPDLAVQSDPAQPAWGQGPDGAVAELVARGSLSEEERQQVERGNQDKHRQLLQTVPQPSPNVQGTTLDGETVLLD